MFLVGKGKKGRKKKRRREKGRKRERKNYLDIVYLVDKYFLDIVVGKVVKGNFDCEKF